MANRKKRKYIIAGSILVLLIVIRLLLPSVVLKYANNALSDISGYYGHVQDIDISLYRGAYQLDSIYIHKKDSVTGALTEFFSAERIDLSVEWRVLLHGTVVGELKFFSPKLIFTKDKAELGEVARDTNDFRKILRDFMPFKVNRFEIENGRIHYVDKTTDPKVDIFLEDARILAQNLKNTVDKGERLPASVAANARAYKGTLSLKMQLNALAEEPTFDLTAEIRDADLVELNDFFKAYGNFDVSRGTLGLYTEFAAEDGKFKGYVKPVIKNLKVAGLEDRRDGLLQRAKEEVIDIAGKILKNPKEEQVASKVPVEGRFDNASVKTAEAVWELLRNAFIEALMPSVDHEIDINSPGTATVAPEKKGFFRSLFSSRKKESDQEESGLKEFSSADKKPSEK